MTVYEAITQAVALRPSEVSRDTMVQWLSALDGKIWIEIVSQYEEHTPETMPAYTTDDDNVNADTELLVEAPYDVLYLDYLVMRIDLENDDYERYNNRAELFNAEYRDFADWYNREHIHSKRVTNPQENRWATWLRF